MQSGRRVSIIIQGEGKGHFSQALEYAKRLKEEGKEIVGVYVGRSLFRKLPAYFFTSFDLKVSRFLSPNFLRSRSKKGIRIQLSVLINLFLLPAYLVEVLRLGFRIKKDKTEEIYNFYDPVGALAGRWFNRRLVRTVISHHFYYFHPDFIHPFGNAGSRFYLSFMNRIMIRSHGKVLALSFRKGKQARGIALSPPIIDRRLREMPAVEGERDLCYFLNSGYVEEIIELYASHREWELDVFCDVEFSGELPSNVNIRKPSRKEFLDKLVNCRRLVCTAGFDLVAEAFYLGKPVFLIPSENHYEQYCNALDAGRTGMAFQLEEIKDLEHADLEDFGNKVYKRWVDEE